MSYIDKKTIKKIKSVANRHAIRMLQSSDILYHNLKNNINMYSEDEINFIKTALLSSKNNIEQALEIINRKSHSR